MNPNQQLAIQLALLLKAAYSVAPGNLLNKAGSTIDAAFDPLDLQYEVLTTIYGADLETDIDPFRKNQIVSFGDVLVDRNSNLVVVLRGTEGIWEWIHDFVFLSVPCPFLKGAGQTEDGFTQMYETLRTDVSITSPTLTQFLGEMSASNYNSLTICGHSLGAALATLLALDVAANTAFSQPLVYTFASPRVGDPIFASVYNKVVPNTARYDNRLDLVPKLPLPPFYEHVAQEFDLNPAQNNLPVVAYNLNCEHSLSTYMYMLYLQLTPEEQQIFGAYCAIDPNCKPQAGLLTALV